MNDEVKFKKTHLLRFLEEYGTDLPEDLIKALKKLRVTQTAKQSEDMLDLEGTGSRTVLEDVEISNLPRQFSLKMPIAENFIGELQFQAELVQARDNYGHTKSGAPLQIELRCVNAREVMRDMMHQILAELPPEVPRYYGRAHVGDPKGSRW